MAKTTTELVVKPPVKGRVPLNLKTTLRAVGEPRIDSELCKGCGFCIEFCPEEVLEFSESINKQGYQYPVIKSGKENSCIACGMCERVCPELAIQVYETEKTPVKVVVK